MFQIAAVVVTLTNKELINYNYIGAFFTGGVDHFFVCCLDTGVFFVSLIALEHHYIVLHLLFRLLLVFQPSWIRIRF